MNYYYDVLLNFNENQLWNFYEWETDDCLLLAKRIPLFRVSHDTILDFLNYHIQMNLDFCQSLIGETKYQGFVEEESVSFIMSDSKNTLAVRLNLEGKVTGLSKLLLRDDNNLNEFIYTVSKTDMEYTLLEKRIRRHSLRQYDKMKDFILTELNTLMDEENIQKLQYFYYEWFQKEATDIHLMYQEMVHALSSLNGEHLSKMHYLIRLSYHQV